MHGIVRWRRVFLKLTDKGRQKFKVKALLEDTD
jgi:DNA-binding MarR family transcriptional regulator